MVHASYCHAVLKEESCMVHASYCHAVLKEEFFYGTC